MKKFADGFVKMTNKEEIKQSLLLVINDEKSRVILPYCAVKEYDFILNELGCIIDYDMFRGYTFENVRLVYEDDKKNKYRLEVNIWEGKVEFYMIKYESR